LTLSRVIVALGTPNASHINFRDSKLTRILQPSLSGNARMAVVCCATPSELYLEETRSTLLFASRAKLVKTNAQINEVLDDRSIIRRLQQELALARRHQSGGSHITANVEQWEMLATSAGNEAKEAKEKLKRLYTSILMNQKLDDANVNLLLPPVPETLWSVTSNVASKKRHRRRLSDGNLCRTKSSTATPSKKSKVSLPSSVPPHNRLSKSVDIGDTIYKEVSILDELSMLREAVVAKDKKALDVKQQMDMIAKELQSKDLDLVASNCSNDLLRSDRDEKSSLITKLQSEIVQLQSELASSNASNKALLSMRDAEIVGFKSKLQKDLEDRRVLEETVDSLQEAKVAKEREFTESLISKDGVISQMSTEIEACRMELYHQTTDVVVSLQQKLDDTVKEKEILSVSLQESTNLLQSSETSHKTISQSHTALEVMCQERQTFIDSMMEQLDTTNAELQVVNKALFAANDVIQKQALSIKNLESNILNHQEHIHSLEEQNDSLVLTNENLSLTYASSHTRIRDLEESLKLIHAQREAMFREIDDAKTESTDLTQMLQISSIKLEGLLVALNHAESGMEEIASQLSFVSKEKVAGEVLAAKMEKASLDFQAQLSGVYSMTETLNDQLIAVSEELKLTKEKCDALDEEKLRLSMVNSQIQASNEEVITKVSEMEHLNHQQANMFRAERENMMKTNETLQRKIKKVIEDASTNIDVLSILLYRCELEKEKIARDFSSLQNSFSVEQTNVKALNQQLASFKSNVNQRIDALISERNEAVEQLASESKILLACKTKLEELSIAYGQTESQLILTTNERNDLQQELLRNRNLLQQSNTEVESLFVQLQASTDEQRKAGSNAHDLTSQLALLKADFDTLYVEKMQLEGKFSMVMAESSIHKEATETSQKNFNDRVQAHEGERSRLFVDLQEAKGKISELKMSLDEVTRQKDDLLAALRTMETKQASVTELNNSYELIRNENTELKLLLANTNQCIDQASNKEREVSTLLDEKSKMLVVAYEHLESKEREVQSLLKRVSNPQEKQIGDDEFQRILKERNYLETRLQKEISDRTLCERELKRQMGDEQRILIQEAEDRMRGLRTELELQRLALEKSEAEAYASREMKDELEDQYKRTLDRALHLENQISTLQSENFKMRQFAREKEGEYESELACLKEQSSQDAAALRNSQILVSDFESKLFRLKEEKSMIELDLSVAQERLMNLHDVKVLEEKNEHLVHEVERLGSELNKFRNSTKENLLPQEKRRELEGENEQLRKKLKSYADRCEKLECSKLTKDKLDAIKKLMVRSVIPRVIVLFYVFTHPQPVIGRQGQVRTRA
jgi:chromosome segregation ATPase